MLLIRKGYVHTMEGEPLDGVDILIEGGKIQSIGFALEVPPEAECLDASGLFVLPGLIDAHTHLGIWEEGSSGKGSQGNEDPDPVTPQLRAIDAINPRDESFLWAREGGVTTVASGPGSGNVIGGQFCIMKTAGNRVDDMVMVPYAALKCAFGENPMSTHGNKGHSPATRMAIAATIREFLEKAFDYDQKIKSAGDDASKRPPKDAKLEAMLPIVHRCVPLKAHVHRSDDILTAVRIAKEFDVRLTLDHCSEGHLIAGELAKEGYPAIVGPFAFVGKSKSELRFRSLETPVALWQAGVKTAITTDATVVPPQYLALSAALACREGMPETDALRAITLTPAEILGVADRVGSIAPGKDADFAIFDRHPFDGRARVLMTVIQGLLVHDKRKGTT